MLIVANPPAFDGIAIRDTYTDGDEYGILDLESGECLSVWPLDERGARVEEAEEPCGGGLVVEGPGNTRYTVAKDESFAVVCKALRYALSLEEGQQVRIVADGEDQATVEEIGRKGL